MRFRLRPMIIFATGALGTWYAATVEAPFVQYIWQHPWPDLRDFMARSLFEGGGFGGSDPGVILAIIAFFLWLSRRRRPVANTLFPQWSLRFIWLSSLSSALLTVHSLKWAISRARPKVFFSGDFVSSWPITELNDVRWPGLMPWDGPRGYSWNSFPSGHTASAAILLAYSYLLWRRDKALSLIIGILIASYCVSMAIARSMAGMHWFSDSIASFFATWLVIDILYARMAPKPENS